MSFDPNLQRQIFGQFATGVTVVGVQVEGETRGMTANAVSSLSLDPPLVLVCVARNSEFHDWISRADAFSMAILNANQQPLSDRFAFSGPKDFSGLNTTTAVTGAPILPACLGWVDCHKHAVLDGGDHDIFVGRVAAGEVGTPQAEPPKAEPPKAESQPAGTGKPVIGEGGADGGPLLYFGGGYRTLAQDS